MSRSGGSDELRRILVAIDASAPSVAALEAAAALAASARADLLGLFVEDVRLLDLARLPAARALNYPSGSDKPLEIGALERDMRVLAESARGALEAAAGRAFVRSAFRIVRGEVAPALRAAAHEADLIILGRTGGRRGGRAALGSTARALLARAPRPLLVHAEAGRSKTVLALFDGGAEGGLVLEHAARLARAGAGDLLVLLDARDRDVAVGLERRAAERLRGAAPAARYRRIASRGARALAEAAVTERAAALVLGAGRQPLRDESIERLVEALSCAVLLVP